MADGHEKLMMAERPIANEQKKANYIVEAISGISLFALAGGVWFLAQQSAHVDDTLQAVKALTSESRVYRMKSAEKMGEVQREVDRIGIHMDTAIRDIEANRSSIGSVQNRLLQMAPMRGSQGTQSGR